MINTPYKILIEYIILNKHASYLLPGMVVGSSDDASGTSRATALTSLRSLIVSMLKTKSSDDSSIPISKNKKK